MAAWSLHYALAITPSHHELKRNTFLSGPFPDSIVSLANIAEIVCTKWCSECYYYHYYSAD